MASNTRLSRRAFLTSGLACGSALVAGAIPVRLLAQDKVAEDDPTAVALGYKHDASEVDTSQWPKRAGDGQNQYCNNCALFAGGADEEWAPCSIFQNRLVANGGWCNAWVAKAA